MYEYTTEVFAVGLEGLAAVDTDKLGDLAAEGWEPSLMTPVHNGFATLVLFRRQSDGTAVPGRLVAPAPKVRAVAPKAAGARGAGAAKAAGARGAGAAKAAGGRGAGAAKAADAGGGAAAGRPSVRDGGRVRRARPT